MIRKLVVVLLTGVMCLVGVTAAFGAEKAEIVYWHAAGQGPEMEISRKIVEDFNAENPQIKVHQEFVPWTKFLDKIFISVAAGEKLDVIRYWNFITAQWAEEGLIKKITGFMEKDQIKPEEIFWPGMWQTCTYRGEIYGLPSHTTGTELFYNKTLFKQAGLDPSKPPKTWEEFEDYAIKLTDHQKGIWGYNVPFKIVIGNHEWLTLHWLMYFWPLGGEVLSTDYKRATFNTPAGIEALKFMVDLVNKYKCATMTPVEEAFEKGKLAMTLSGDWMIPPWKARKELDFGTGMFPLPPGGVPAQWDGGDNLYIVKTCEDDAAAYEFMKYWAMNEKVQQEWQKEGGHVASLRSLGEKYIEFEPRIEPFIDSLEYQHVRPQTPKWTEVSLYIAQALEKAGYAYATPEEALKEAEEKVNMLLAK